jgi:hypothetical protein
LVSQLRRSSVLIAVAAAFLYLLVAAQAWNPQARTFPVAIAAPGFVLALIELARSRRPDREPAPTPAERPAGESAWEAFGWVAALMVGGVLVGLPLAIPIFVVSYLQLRARASRRFTLVGAAVTSALTWAVFDLVLHTDWGTPLLFQVFLR